MFFQGMFRKDSPDRSKPADWTNWVSSISGINTKAGAIVTTETALANAALRACVTLLAESIAQLPCELYRRDGKDGRSKAIDHPLYEIIHNTPNRKDTSFDYYEQSQGALSLEGNSYSFIERDASGYISELLPINPKKVRVLKGYDLMPYYHIMDIDEILPSRLVHHIKAFSLNGYVGLSPLQTSADVIGLGLATEEHAAAVFSRGTTMSGVIERPNESGTIDSQEGVDRILAKFVDRHSGLNNLFSIAMLQEGMSYKQLSMDNEKAQLIESRKFSVNDICRLYKVPPHMIQQLDKASFNNIEHQGLQFVIYTLLSWIKRQESAMMRDLLLPEERKKFYIEFNVSSLLRADQKSRYEAYAMGRQWGWLSVNDIRRMENMSPIIGGNSYLAPMNMVDSASTQKSMQTKLDATKANINSVENIICPPQE